jgi:peptidoglycan/LPS O-acetylase OafA/YrhL
LTETVIDLGAGAPGLRVNPCSSGRLECKRGTLRELAERPSSAEVDPGAPLTAGDGANGRPTSRAMSRSGSLAHVPALDGLRAVAVSMVIAYHLGIAQVGGGFLGVDLFFVLSGFLITTLLLREFAANGRIDLVSFWLRRARRLLPALFVLLAVTAVWAGITSPFDRDVIRWDILSALGYVANWRFIAEGQSYFEQFLSPSPVKHLWSLAIEEQFYVVWPLIAFGALAAVRRFRARGRWLALSLLGAGIVGSAASLALLYNRSDPSVAYYSTFTRAHELLIGALAAALVAGSPRLTGFLGRHASPISAVGLAGVVASSVLVSDSASSYYHGGAAAFSLLAAVLIGAVVAGAGSRGYAIRLLELRPVVWLGAVSYGAYLWHWPMIVWLTPTTTGLDGPALAFTRIAATLLVTTASFYIIEKPIRRGTLGRIRLAAPQVFAGAASCVLVVGSFTIVQTQGSEPIPQFLITNRDLLTNTVPASRGEIGLVGDSVAGSLYPGFAYEAASRSLSIVAATFPGLSIGDTPRVDKDGIPFSQNTEIPLVVAKQRAMIDEYDPKLIFWTTFRERFDILDGNAVLAGGTPEWERAIFADWDRVLARLTARGAHIVLILPLHAVGVDPTTCLAQADLSSVACTRPYLSDGGERTEYLRWAARHQTQVTVINLDPFLCPSDLPCPDVLSGVTLHSDAFHFTEKGALLVAADLFSVLPQGLLP